MRIEDFPRPTNDNRRGVHWSASVYHPTGAALDFWISELQAMHIKWVKIMDDSGGSSLELCQRLLAADIMPIVRLYRLEPNPGHIGGREEETARVLIANGVRYFETNNEPDLPAEWQGGHMPDNALDIVIDNFIYDADKLISLGGLPALPAMGVASKDNPMAVVVQKGRADLFEKGAWVAIHNYTLNHPLDYPYDAVEQEGAPVSQEEYDRLGSWAWDGQPRDMINEWRAADKHPGFTLTDDAVCFLAFHLADEMIVQTLGHKVPIISTEGGPVMGWRDDRRYPRTTPGIHADWVVAINDFMQGNSTIRGLTCPNNYFSMCHWLLGNYRLGFMAPGWESQSWYSDWWNSDFNLSGELPVVAAVKAMPNIPVDQAYNAVVAGKLVRADTSAPLSGLRVQALANDRVVATATSAADGSFRLERLIAGVYDLAVGAWGIVRRGVTAAPEPVQAITIALSGGASSSLAGTVANPGGTAQADVHVSLRRGTSLQSAIIGEADTAADGYFSFASLPLGVYSLSIPNITLAGIALDGWASKSLQLTTGTAAGYRYGVVQRRLLPEDETTGRILYGTVSNASGTPVNGITVRMSWQGAEAGTEFPTVVTGHDPYKPVGRYEFTATEGVFALDVVQGDWPSDTAADLDTAHVAGREGQPISYEVNFRLQSQGAPTRVQGTITGAQPGTMVRLVGASGTREAETGEGGSFEFSDVPAGSYRLELPGIGVMADGIVLEAASLFKMLFPMLSRISGQVNSPPADSVALLHAPAAWGWTLKTTLDSAGKFVFQGLPPGLYRLEVGGQTLSDLELTGENTLQLAAIDLTQGLRSVVRGRVADRSGHPQADLQVTLRRDGSVTSGDAVTGQARTAADGAYSFTNLAAGTYSLDVAGMGQVASGIALDGEREQVRDVLWGSAGLRGEVQGRVLAANGTPQASLTVRLLRDNTEVGHMQSDSSGGFRFTELSAGVYALSVGDGAAVVSGIDLQEDATVSRDVTLPAATGKVLAQYLLLHRPSAGASPDAEDRLEQGLALRYLSRTGASGGFSADEAALAQQVTLVGDRIPDSVEETLRVAGCSVTRLRGDGYALAAAFAQLLASAKKGVRR